MTAMQIRQAWPDDASAVAGVYVRSWQVAFAGLVPQHGLDAMGPSREESGWKTRIAETQWPTSGVLVAEPEVGIVGFAGFSPSQETPAVAEIGTLYAMPEVWGTGIGKQLMLATLTPSDRPTTRKPPCGCWKTMNAPGASTRPPVGARTARPWKTPQAGPLRTSCVTAALLASPLTTLCVRRAMKRRGREVESNSRIRCRGARRRTPGFPPRTLQSF
jgi:hypothetical protein